MQRIEDNADDFKYLIHAGIKSHQGYGILFDYVNDIEHRKKSISQTFRLFADFSLFDSKNLVKKYKHLESARKCLMQEKLWLIRESSVKGLLTVDYLKYNHKTHEFVPHSLRFMLGESGWYPAPVEIKVDQLPPFIPVDSTLPEDEVFNFLLFLDQYKFNYDMLLEAKVTQEIIDTPALK
jgi:hypothetical protein